MAYNNTMRVKDTTATTALWRHTQWSCPAPRSVQQISHISIDRFVDGFRPSVPARACSFHVDDGQQDKI